MIRADHRLARIPFCASCLRARRDHHHRDAHDRRRVRPDPGRRADRRAGQAVQEPPHLRRSSSLYVELVRGIPLLVQLIWWYFAFPSVAAIDRRVAQPRLPGQLPRQPDRHGHHRPDLLLWRLHERDLPRRHPEHPQGPDGGRPQPGHDLCPGHAPRRPAPGGPRDPAARGQRVHLPCSRTHRWSASSRWPT